MCTKTKYNILDSPSIMFILFDIQYDYKDRIYKIVEDKIIWKRKIENKLVGIINAPRPSHFNVIIFNPLGGTLYSSFKSNLIYYHDSLKNNGVITPLNRDKDRKALWIPYISIYKKLNI